MGSVPFSSVVLYSCSRFRTQEVLKNQKENQSGSAGSTPPSSNDSNSIRNPSDSETNASDPEEVSDPEETSDSENAPESTSRRPDYWIAPPELDNPIVLEVQPDGSIQKNGQRLSSVTDGSGWSAEGRDVLIQWPQSVVTRLSSIKIFDANNIVSMGGSLRPEGQYHQGYEQGLFETRRTRGVIHFERMHIIMRGRLTGSRQAIGRWKAWRDCTGDVFAIAGEYNASNPTASSCPDLIVQGCRILGVMGSKPSQLHADVVQCRGPIGDVRFLDCSISSGYQVCLWVPIRNVNAIQPRGKFWGWRNVNLHALRKTSLDHGDSKEAEIFYNQGGWPNFKLVYDIRFFGNTIHATTHNNQRLRGDFTNPDLGPAGCELTTIEGQPATRFRHICNSWNYGINEIVDQTRIRWTTPNSANERGGYQIDSASNRYLIEAYQKAGYNSGAVIESRPSNGSFCKEPEYKGDGQDMCGYNSQAYAA